jgi:hypothetical protein
MSKRIVNTNIRLNLDNADDRRAWERLQKRDKKLYKSYTRAIVVALNDFFDRRERLVSDPYLETREKEDAFLKRVLDTVERGLLSAIASGGPVTLSVSATAAQSPRNPVAVSVQAEADKAALAFLDSF